MQTVGVISDTHLTGTDNPAPLKLIASGIFSTVDLVLHAGDMVDIGLFRDLFSDRPFYAVSGNMDLMLTRQEVPLIRTVKVEDATIGLIHGHGIGGSLPDELFQQFRPVDAIVFGHTHRPLCETRQGVLLFNPGSAFHPSGSKIGTVGLLEVDGGEVRGKILPVPAF